MISAYENVLFYLFHSGSCIITINPISAEICYYSPSSRNLLLSRTKMVHYEVTIFTGNRAFATTINNVYIKLVGTDGESCCTWAEGPLSFIKGAVSLKYPSLNV